MLDVFGSMSGAPVAAMDARAAYRWLLFDFNLISLRVASLWFQSDKLTGGFSLISIWYMATIMFKYIPLTMTRTRLLLKPTGSTVRSCHAYMWTHSTLLCNQQADCTSGKQWLQLLSIARYFLHWGREPRGRGSQRTQLSIKPICYARAGGWGAIRRPPDGIGAPEGTWDRNPEFPFAYPRR